MTVEELKDKIKTLTVKVIQDRKKAEYAAVEFDELTKFPELKEVILNLLTSDFDSFIASIDWVAPRPTTFRVNLQNDEEFYLIWMRRSWIAQVEGKKYYLLNLPEEERAVEAIARILRYGPASTEEESTDIDTTTDTNVETTDDAGSDEVVIDDETNVDIET
jgi:c-di-AMP phosphodiesterase-like protein